MGNPDYNWYILFPNHREGLRLNRELKERGIKNTIAPTPRIASTSCGISLIVDEADLDDIKQIITDREISIERMVQVPVQNSWQYRSC